MEGYGLTLTDWEKLRGLFAVNERLEAVILYGSRAKGNYRPFSDVDFALVGEELTCEDLYRLKEAIDDLLLPFSFDISLLHNEKSIFCSFGCLLAFCIPRIMFKEHFS